MRPKAVLVVDDEDSVRLVVARTLESAGHRVVQAEDGLQALALLATTPVDLLLTDVRMPILGGADLVRQAHERWPALPVVWMSGFIAHLSDVEVRVLQPLPSLPKPFAPERLLEAVAAALEP
ncbi:MAG TPA: response regulator [Gemmatimonadales bacterium]|nr:response regulator [Gemmatimonadales bacterium]